MPLVHDELCRTARRFMRKEAPGNSLQTNALVNEAYLKLVGAQNVRWQDRTHFFAVSAQIMRRILVDTARARYAEKRGGEIPKVPHPHAKQVALNRPAKNSFCDPGFNHPGKDRHDIELH